MSKTKRKLTADQIRELTNKPTTREGKRLDAAKPAKKLGAQVIITSDGKLRCKLGEVD